MENSALDVWREVKPFNDEIVEVEVLQEEEIASVYRLNTNGDKTPNIIAKRAVQEHIIREKYAYEKVLPFISMVTPLYFGSVKEENRKYEWIFIEDVGGENYNPDSIEHRILGGEGLGLLHVSTSEIDQRPEKRGRDLGYWGNLVGKSVEVLSTNLSNRSLAKVDVALMMTIIGYCETIKRNWHQLKDFYDKIPQVFVHGDFQKNNIRLLSKKNEKKRICVFDWAEAGWGTPALDVTRFLNYLVNPDLSAYCRVTQKKWPEFNETTVQRLGYIGDLFRCIDSIRWEAENLQYDWVETSISTLKCYELWLAEIIDAAPWSNDYLFRSKNQVKPRRFNH